MREGKTSTHGMTCTELYRNARGMGTLDVNRHRYKDSI
jgi:hypothetical protein